MTYSKWTISLLIPLLFVSGCVGGGVKKDEPPEKEHIKIVELRNEIAETNMHMEEMNNKFMLLQEKVVANAEKNEALKLELSALKAALVKAKVKVGSAGAGGAGDDTSKPRDLKIITLKDVEVAAEEEAKRKRVTPRPATAEDVYSKGQDLFLSGKYKEARNVFRTIVKKFPDHSLADNALYWMGESYYSTQNYEMAIVQFRKVSTSYPDENKCPDAILKTGYSYLELERPEEAAVSFERLISDYPDSEAAFKAAKKIKEIPK